MKKLLFIASFAFASFATSAYAASTYYVDANASSTTHDGISQETAFLTIPEAVSVANEGDIVSVAAGTYNVTSQLTLTKAISIIGQGTVTVLATSDFGTDNATKHMLNAYAGTETVPTELSNLTFDCDGKCYGLQAYNNAYLKLTNVAIKNSKGAALTVNGSTVLATTLSTEGNAWGAVNVDPGSGVTTPSVFILSSGTLGETNKIWSDGDHVTDTATVTVNAAGYKEYAVAGNASSKFWTDSLSGKATITRDGITTAYPTIQSAIDAAVSGETVHVAPGTYDETATNRMVDGASYQFGLFFGTPTITLQAETAGTVTVTTNATNNFGPSGTFVAADNITIDGIEFSTNASGLNKTIEVIGDNFTLKNSKLSETDAALYISDFTADAKVNKYTITNNVFDNGATITLASGAGSATSSPLTDRQITGNTFNGSSDTYARISFSGAGGQPWYVYPVGGAVITGNTFNGSDKWAIRSRGTVTDPSQFDWSSYWNNNTFAGAVVTLSNESAFTTRDYSYSTYTNVRSIGSNLDWALTNASSSDTILVKGTTTVTSTLNLTAPITIKGVNGGTISTNGGNNVFKITSDNVTIQGLNIVKSDNTDQQLIAIQSGNNVSIKSNVIHGQFTIGGSEVTRAMVVSAGLSGLTIDGNTIYGLRQPAYVSGTTTGTVSNNFVYGTKGWVLENGNLTFTGNTWGTGTQANVFDIAIIPAVATNFYTDIVAMANANNDAVIEDQRMSPAKLSVVYVQNGVNYSSDLGGRYHPYNNMTDATARVVTGGKVIVSGFDAVPSTSTTTTAGVQTTISTNTELTATTTAGSVVVLIPESTTITGPATWDGTFDLPVVDTTPSIPTEQNGSWINPIVSIKIGASDVPLTFNQAVKLTFAGQAGKGAAWSRSGTYGEITAICDNATNPTLADGADCKIDSGADLIVWTKHATTFSAITKTAIPYGGGGSSSGGSSGSTGSTGGSVGSSQGTPSRPVVVVVPTTPVTTPQGQVLGATSYAFSRNLSYGVTGEDVTELQKILMEEGYLKIKVATKWFGPLTKAALVKWQAKHGIPATGYFGSISRNFLLK